MCALSINPIGGFAAAGSERAKLERACARFRRRDRRAGAAKVSRAVRRRRRPHHPQCRRLGSAGAGLRARQRASPICARWRPSGIALDAARDADLFPALAPTPTNFSPSAKFRAVRKLWARVEAACGLDAEARLVTAETAWRMMTQRDPYVNMLRTTIAVAAAGLGGADAITVLPHTAAARPARRASRAASRATRSLSCWKNRTSPASPIRPPAPARSKR